MPQVTWQRGNDYVIVGREDVLAAPFGQIEGRTLPAGSAEARPMENNRNFFITIALSVLILTLWQVFYMNPRIEAERKAAEHRSSERVEDEKKAAARRIRAHAGERPAPPAGRACRPTFPARDGAAAASREAALAATPARQDRHAEPLRLDQPDRRRASTTSG